ncbi:MAG TPA: hypothetical protein VEB40_13805 [Flavipsychrobacter sp.]|nr:hypothetical protein [Flavipsychrobacter sp.]
MRLKLIAFVVFSLCFSLSAEAQKQKKKSKAPKAGAVEKPVNTFKKPSWAPTGYSADHHVYFPDYYTFYDPRRGYVTWEKDSWVASPTMPLFLSNEDLSKARIQILNDISIDKRPELSYPRYMKMYPARPGSKEILAPVPAPAGQPGKH